MFQASPSTEQQLQIRTCKSEPANPSHRQPAYDDDSDDKDLVIDDYRPARRGCYCRERDVYGRKHDYEFERDTNDFKLQVDISNFNGNLDIDDLIAQFSWS